MYKRQGRNIVHVGASGAGQVAKAANQIVTGMGVLAVAEAFAFAAKNGVDRGKVREALLGGFAYSKILENHGQRMPDRNFKPCLLYPSPSPRDRTRSRMPFSA